MIDISRAKNLSKEDKYKLAIEMIRRQFQEETNFIANLANTAAIIYHLIDGVSWSGFYLYDGTNLVLGPFQGKPACNRIMLGKGVCGTAYSSKKTIVVDDVNSFAGHIACDAMSKSEIVVPIYNMTRGVGVLDIDSYEYSNFDTIDKEYLEKIVDYIVKHSDTSLR